MLQLKYKLLHPDAKPPYKKDPNDVGWDLTLVAIDKELTERANKNRLEYLAYKRYQDSNIHLYKNIYKDRIFVFDTGVAFIPECDGQEQYYLDIVPRSSQSWLGGWMMKNSIGIIENTFYKPIKVCMIKVLNDAPDIELPGRYVQAIVKKRYDYGLNPIEISDEIWEKYYQNNSRDGLGSTGR